MDEKTIKLADGTTIQNCGAGYVDGYLWIYPALTMKETAGLFLDEEKTAEILYIVDGKTIRYKGYTDCILLNAVPGGVRVQMTGGTEPERIINTEQN